MVRSSAAERDGGGGCGWCACRFEPPRRASDAQVSCRDSCHKAMRHAVSVCDTACETLRWVCEIVEMGHGESRQRSPDNTTSFHSAGSAAAHKFAHALIGWVSGVCPICQLA